MKRLVKEVGKSHYIAWEQKKSHIPPLLVLLAIIGAIFVASMLVISYYGAGLEGMLGGSPIVVFIGFITIGPFVIAITSKTEVYTLYLCDRSGVVQFREMALASSQENIRDAISTLEGIAEERENPGSRGERIFANLRW